MNWLAVFFGTTTVILAVRLFFAYKKIAESNKVTEIALRNLAKLALKKHVRHQDNHSQD